MFFDYIYLLLIIIVIIFIIFIIYLSYDYRTIEPFGLQEDTSKNINKLIKDISVFNKNYNSINNYTNFEKEIDNRDKNRDNIKRLQLNNEKLNKNINVANTIKKLELTTKPTIAQFPIDKLIKTIKSKYNSQYISTFSNDILKYGILVNDKCLTVNGLCKEDFCLLNCKNNLYTSTSQKFSTERVNNANDAAKIMNVTSDKISTKNVYPFNIFKSAVNDNCLTINNEGITVENCNLNNIKQQWEISPNENICVLK